MFWVTVGYKNGNLIKITFSMGKRQMWSVSDNFTYEVQNIDAIRKEV